MSILFFPACPAPRRRSRSRYSRRAFTLVELLTVIAIIGILAAIIIPVAGRVRATARQVQCLGNVRQIALACRMYADDNKQLFPYMYADSDATPQKVWGQSIAPWLGYNPDRYGAAPLVNSLGIQICPVFVPDPDRATSYGLNLYMAKGQTFSHRWSYKVSVIPSLPNTFLLGEKNRNIDQVGNRTDGERPEYRHSDGSNWAYCDGHVQYIKGPVPDDDPRWKWW